ncbi:MAG: phosphodiesterase YaeI [Planctomycetes bacterium]|nr:phosphodiesterase YaeI [Planctomycetota bacterium]
MPKPRRTLSRRSFLRWAGYGTVGAVGAALGTFGYARFIEPWWIDYSHTTVRLRNLPPAFDGLRIAHLTDLHYNPVSLDEVVDWVDRTNHLRPDMVVLTGDFVTGSRVRVAEMAAALRHLHAPLGTVACLGNHDYGLAYPKGVPGTGKFAATTRKALEDAGIEVLVNEFTTRSRDDQTLHLAGLGDLWSDDFDFDVLHTPPARPLIVLAHNPETLYSLHQFDSPNFDLMLSGHTHGGQVRLPLYGPPRLPIKYRHLAEGLFHHKHAQVYVSRGLGYLTPIRFRARPELGIIELRTA